MTTSALFSLYLTISVVEPAYYSDLFLNHHAKDVNGSYTDAKLINNACKPVRLVTWWSLLLLVDRMTVVLWWTWFALCIPVPSPPGPTSHSLFFPFPLLLIFFPVVPPTYIQYHTICLLSLFSHLFSFLLPLHYYTPFLSPLHHFLLFSPASFPSFLPLPPFITHHSAALGDRREEYWKLLPLCHSIYYIFCSLFYHL